MGAASVGSRKVPGERRVSWLAVASTLLYLGPAIYVVQDEVRHSHGGWINLRGFGTTLITAPSQATLGVVLDAIGVGPVEYARLGPIDFTILAAHVAVTAAMVGLVVHGAHRLVRRLLAAVR